MSRSVIQVHCPSCQHQQTEPEGVVSTSCRACGSYIRVTEAQLKKIAAAPKATKTVHCLSCHTPVRVVESAMSSICPNCSMHLNLQNYRLSSGDDAYVNTLGTVTIHGRKRYEGNEIYASRIEIACRASARFVAREEAILLDNGSLEGKLEAPKILVAPKASTKARIILSPLLEVEGELVCEQVRSKKIIIKENGTLIAKRILCEEVEVTPGGILRGRLTTFNMEAQASLNP